MEFLFLALLTLLMSLLFFVSVPSFLEKLEEAQREVPRTFKRAPRKKEDYSGKAGTWKEAAPKAGPKADSKSRARANANANAKGQSKSSQSSQSKRSSTSKVQSFYEVLGVDVRATVAEIKKAWRKLCSKHHPDRGGSTAKMTSINEAYNTLSDAKKRAHYDYQQQFNQGRRP